MPNMQQETCEYFIRGAYQCMIRNGMPCDNMTSICKMWRWNKLEKKKHNVKKQTWFDLELAPYSRHHHKDSQGVRF